MQAVVWEQQVAVRRYSMPNDVSVSTTADQ